jgi:membrane protein
MKLTRTILTIKPAANLIKWSKRVSIPGFNDVPVFDVMVFFFEQTRKIGFSGRAATIAFNVLMAIPAGLLALCAIVPMLPTAIQFERELLQAIDDVLADEKAYKLVAGIVHDFFNTRQNSILSFSVLMALFFSSNAMMGIMHTFDRSYFEERSAMFMAKRWTAIKLTSFLLLLVMTSVLLLATQGPIRKFILQQMGWDIPIIRAVIEYSRWVVIIALTYFTIAFIYRWAPAVKTKWKITSPGVILATVLMLLTTWLFSLWMANFGSLNKVYGSIGTVLLLMNLVYFNSLILLVGFEVNVSILAIGAASRRRLQAEKESA